MVSIFGKEKNGQEATERGASQGEHQEDKRPRGVLGDFLRPGQLNFDQR